VVAVARRVANTRPAGQWHITAWGSCGPAEARTNLALGRLAAAAALRSCNGCERSWLYRRPQSWGRSCLSAGNQTTAPEGKETGQAVVTGEQLVV